MRIEQRADGYYLVDSTGAVQAGPLESIDQVKAIAEIAGVTLENLKDFEPEETTLSKSFPTIQGNDGKYYIVQASSGAVVGGPYENSTQATYARNNATNVGNRFTPAPVPDVLQQAPSEGRPPISERYKTVQGADGQYYIADQLGNQVAGPYPNASQASLALANAGVGSMGGQETFIPGQIPGGLQPQVSETDPALMQRLQAEGFGPNLSDSMIVSRALDGLASPEDAWMALQVFGQYTPDEATTIMQSYDAQYAQEQGRQVWQPPAAGTGTLTPTEPGTGTLTPTGPNMASPTGRTVEQIRAAGTYVNDAERRWFLQQLQAQGVPLGGEAQAFLGTTGGGQLTLSGGGVVPAWLNAPVTQGYGPTSTSLDSAYKGAAHFNKGIDYQVPIGTPIEALRGGTVVNAGDAGDGWGTSVKVRDAEGNIVNYGHLSAANVQVGNQIQPGQIVGASGNSGRSTGPHLSLDIMNAAGEWVDPTPFIESAKAGGVTGGAGGTPTIPGYDPQAVATLYDAARQAGFTGDALNRAVASALAETGGNFRAENRSALGVQENSMGAWQINLDAHADKVPGATFEDKVEWLKDPYNAAQIAFQVSSGGTDFSPWSVWHENVGAPAQAIYSQLNAAAPGGTGTATATGFGPGGGTNAFGPGPQVQEVLTRLQQLEADFKLGKFGSGAAAEAEYLRQKAAIEAELAVVQQGIAAQQQQQTREQADAAVRAEAQRMGAQLGGEDNFFATGHGAGFAYVPDASVAGPDGQPMLRRMDFQYDPSTGTVETTPGPISQSSTAHALGQQIDAGGSFALSPQEAAVASILGPTQGGAFAQEAAGLGTFPTIPLRSQLGGIGESSINAAPRFMGTPLDVEQLLGLAQGPVGAADVANQLRESIGLAATAGPMAITGGGGTTRADVLPALQEAAEKAYPDNPTRQRQYIDAALAMRSITNAGRNPLQLSPQGQTLFGQNPALFTGESRTRIQNSQGEMVPTFGLMASPSDPNRGQRISDAIREVGSIQGAQGQLQGDDRRLLSKELQEARTQEQFAATGQDPFAPAQIDPSLISYALGLIMNQRGYAKGGSFTVDRPKIVVDAATGTPEAILGEGLDKQGRPIPETVEVDPHKDESHGTAFALSGVPGYQPPMSARAQDTAFDFQHFQNVQARQAIRRAQEQAAQLEAVMNALGIDPLREQREAQALSSAGRRRDARVAAARQRELAIQEQILDALQNTEDLVNVERIRRQRGAYNNRFALGGLQAPQGIRTPQSQQQGVDLPPGLFFEPMTQAEQLQEFVLPRYALATARAQATPVSAFMRGNPGGGSTRLGLRSRPNFTGTPQDPRGLAAPVPAAVNREHPRRPTPPLVRSGAR